MKEGKIGGILLSEVSEKTIRRSANVHQIGMVEAEVSLWSRDIFQNGVAETCKELGIVILAYTPLGRGMLAGNFGNLEDVENIRREIGAAMTRGFRARISSRI